ncbi:MAG: hypothetical protein GXY85_01275 [Candidatus Brocadiaceae bacterium]|mgnify:CR=1 FL=1|nr:hypothetical protein [Candidatus Brocadiaceae bacterium]
MTPIRVTAIIFLATALALGVVWQNARIRQVGYELSALNGRLAEQRAELAIHKAHLSKLKSPQRIVALVEWLGLDLQERPVPLPPRPDGAGTPADVPADEAERAVAALSMP